MSDHGYVNSDPVGKALLMAFRARVRVLRNKNHKTDCTHEALECCDRGGALLRESIAFASLHPENHLLKVCWYLS